MMTSQEKAKASHFFYTLVDIVQDSIGKTGRNDACFCNSGKKYKKCCIRFEGNLDSDPSIQFGDNLSAEDFKDGREDVSPEVQVILGNLHARYLQWDACSEQKKEQFFTALTKLRQKYPRCPIILNYLHLGYESTKQVEKAQQVMLETNVAFPHYLFGKILYASWHLDKEEPEKALAVFNGATSLKQAFPHRTLFDIQEGMSFQNFLIRYYIALEKPASAELHYRYFCNLGHLYNHQGTHEAAYDLRRMIAALRIKKRFDDL